ncbi:baseplate multidomain protein megatron [Prosthecomicrobium pneumaticum]|uniref:Host specificity protein n=1 Tax=Prosthecomicrobium pneumaticum TaxID=81895 RepID=A0A7W9FR27_9HYPH|nr:glycoside hydrolase/phage tail family protein [Prosthecomicrobium pneumaticum]MBB5755279.1 hypothetical protein [Prosthecomicrobium pneumaticum]
MATLLLRAAGAAIGGLFGPLGAVLGGAVGALAGYTIDQRLFGGGTVEGARLGTVDIQGSREGTPIPRVYGRARVSGQIIWATRYQERVSTETQGGKGGAGGTSVRTYSYFANFAVGLCEGPIARVGRVWADGALLDLSGIVHRVHPGGEDEAPDSLIEAKQGEGNTPAYRGLAHVVFEGLPLEDFGNRIPQLAFEVFRPVEGLESDVRAVVMMPGATEFGYDPEPVDRALGRGRRETVNRHVDGAETDFVAALDAIEAALPNLERVSLVVAWFGDDLRAGSCTIRPKVETAAGTTSPPWRVAGLERGSAAVVSLHAGRPAYGGTPSDAGVIRAIAALKARGLAVTLYPFLMMDVPAGNGRPDPYGRVEQGAYPWRGEITGAVAPGRAGTTDGTAAATDEIAAFLGTCDRHDFALSGGGVVYSGPAEWRYRRMVLHMAHLAEAAGGVDAFLIGAEMRGLSTLRAEDGRYPFVEGLRALAGEVRAVLGPATKISYAADWSEYSGHRPADGSGDVTFHLDPLWADPAIDAVAIDCYFPLADWRDGTAHRDAAIADGPHDRAYLAGNIAGGEGFDWYYASEADRAAQIRSPIEDGAAGKPWVFRYKDLAGWWGHLHYDRPGGIERTTPTAWIPKSKPIWLTELGCPAVDKGANEPNVFPDDKVGGARLPHFSNGTRDDLVQRRFLEAHLEHWADETANPLSDRYDGRMVDRSRVFLWCVDARPYPAFPYLDSVWADGPNWQTGHWLTGRLGALPADALVRAVLADHGFTDAEIGALDGLVDGYVVGRTGSARDALEPLATLFGFVAAESGAALRFVPKSRPARLTIGRGELVESEDDRPRLTVRRAQETELPAEVSLGFVDGLADYRDGAVASRRLETGSRRQQTVDSGAVMDEAAASGFADALLADLWAGRETVSFALDPHRLDVEPGDIVGLDSGGEGRIALIVGRIEDGAARAIEARTIAPMLAPARAAPRAATPSYSASAGPPDLIVLDLPPLADGDADHAPRVALFADPWPGAYLLQIGTAETGFAARQAVERRATAGALDTAMPPGPPGRWDEATAIEVTLDGGALSGASALAVANGANAAAIGSAETGFEVVQFRDATLIGPSRWRLSGFLRGQAGTEDRAAAGHAGGARFVRLDAAAPVLALATAEGGLGLTLRAGPAGAAYDPRRFADTALPASRIGLRCRPPAHLAVRREAGDLVFAWIRQTRTGGDDWAAVEVPLGEAAEAYRIEIVASGAVVAAETVTVPGFRLTGAARAALLGAADAPFTFRVAQTSAAAGPGLFTEIAIDG